MPVVELNINRIRKLVSVTVSRKQILDVLPFLGLDIESEDGDKLRIEYSPNRPDYSTEFGVAHGLQGLLGIKKGIQKSSIKKNGKFTIKVDSSLTKIRPYVTGIIAKNGTLDSDGIQQLMWMQEDLHDGIGRKRKKSSIGLHDADKIAFPLTYTTTSREHKFVPLNSNTEQTIDEILSNTEQGQNYGWVIENAKNMPIILDSEQNTISFPPIINSTLTTVTPNTHNILVEVTGIDKDSVEDALSIVMSTLQMAGFEFEELKIMGNKNSTPQLKDRTIVYDPKFTPEILGIEMSLSNMVTCLKKCRLDASVKGKKITCTIPRYRFDIFGPMDLVEEIALGYGIANIEPKLSPSTTIGQKNDVTIKTKLISKTAVGLGFLEAMNSSLTSKKILYEMTQRNSSEIISVLDSKSQEHTILRDSLLPSLLENLSKNIHESYPQKLFETGVVFSKGEFIHEFINLAVVIAHKDTNYSEIKAIMQSLLQTNFKINSETKTSKNHELFAKGRHADIFVNDKKIGEIGELDSKILENFRIRTSVVGFEIKLSGLIFD
ncbi:MAG: phenylalanine--tRNA ligase subunit beta [Candidatus Nitrosopelagicus sp.]|nr:phenylalanine--tRNA ligase subunit beta [Candidatus Nitrosopelagicus sp.]